MESPLQNMNAGTEGAGTSSLICALCMECFVNKKELRDHYKSVHKDGMVKIEPQKRRLERKFNRHLCSLCGKHFADMWTLSHHQKTVHRAAREHKCDKCDKAFLSNKDLVRHNRGVHLGEKIIFPGEKSRRTVKYPLHQNSISGDGVEKLNNKLPNILKYSKSERKSSLHPAICKLETNVAQTVGSVVRVIGLEKARTEPGAMAAEAAKTESEVLVEIDEAEVEAVPGEAGGGDQPMFQLENLENLQLVVPDPDTEEAGEPRIIIPESGIRLTIQGSGAREPGTQASVLHLIPETSLAAAQQQEEHEMPVLEMQGKPAQAQAEDTEGGQAKHFVYRKEVESDTPRLVAVNEPSYEGFQQFNCPKCSKCFITKDFLDKHMVTSHAELSTFNISYINPLPLDTSLDLSGVQNLGGFEDIDIDFNNDDISCVPVLKGGCIDVLLSSDSVSKTTPKVEIICNLCDEKFDTRAAQQKHKKNFHKKQIVFKCEDCNSVFTSNQTLKAHVQSIHEGIKKVCSVCLKPVVDLTRHIRDQHKNGGKREFHCDICKTDFRTNFSLQRHKETVHMKLKAWSCDLCEKCFGEKRDMVRHKNAVHFGIKNKNNTWNCPECNITFKLRREYDDHKASHHSQLSEEQIVKFLNSEMEARQKQKFQINNTSNVVSDMGTKLSQ